MENNLQPVNSEQHRYKCVSSHFARPLSHLLFIPFLFYQPGQLGQHFSQVGAGCWEGIPKRHSSDIKVDRGQFVSSAGL